MVKGCGCFFSRRESSLADARVRDRRAEALPW
jgi:hypothetical protein